jgi:hypothetical protein
MLDGCPAACLREPTLALVAVARVGEHLVGVQHIVGLKTALTRFIISKSCAVNI